MINHLVRLCKGQLDEDVRIEDPKKYFDDAIIEVRIKKLYTNTGCDQMMNSGNKDIIVSS